MYKIIVAKRHFEEAHPWVTYTDDEVLAALGVVPEEYSLVSAVHEPGSSCLIFWIQDKSE